MQQLIAIQKKKTLHFKLKKLSLPPYDTYCNRQQ